MKQLFQILVLTCMLSPARAQLTLLKDIYPGNAPSNPMGFCILNGKVYFSASTYDSAIHLPGFTENELWVTDGTTAGTYKVYDHNASSLGTSVGPTSIVSVNNRLLFIGAYSGGIQLWTSDGSSSGTQTLV